MKSTTVLTVLALGVTTVLAAPAPNADPEPEARWCTWIGQSCWKVKRTAEAFAEALTTSGPAETSVEARFSNAPGGAAHHAKRAVDDLAAIIAATSGDPRAYYNLLGLDVHFLPDEPANKTDKRDIAAREADARWCTWIGQSCWKARRAAEAVVSTIDGFDKEKRQDAAFEPVAFGKRAADPAADPRWCTWIGQSCWKRDEVSSVAARCNAVGGQCATARRDLHAMYNAARSVLDELPPADKQ